MMLDDLTSEGYTALNEQLEAAFRGVSRLRDYLRKHQTEPVPENQPDSTCISYAPQELELCGAIRRAMLERIDAERIPVVKSGCAGTFPPLLMNLAPCVDLHMYTTYPYLTGIYGPRVFTSRYDETRTLEAFASQALSLRFFGLPDGRFYVQTCTDLTVKTRALAEIKLMQAR